MGDLAADTAVQPVAGQPGEGASGEGSGIFTAVLSPEWEIWGPMGGYVAAVALRAAGAVSPFRRPATFACHYLAVARFEPVQLAVTVQRATRTAPSLDLSVAFHEAAPASGQMLFRRSVPPGP